MSEPGFSILVCNFNYAGFVGEALDSCLAQRYPAGRFEVIVVDDGSTDESRAVLARYDGIPNVTVLHQANLGQAAAFAAGLARARCDYVCLLDSDDLYRPDKLEALAARIERIGPRAEDFFLCHDLELVEHPEGRLHERGWFDVTGISSYGESAHLAALSHFYPFSVPCGQVYGRGLLERVLEGLPLFDWRRGADTAIAHGALMHCGRVHYLGRRLAAYRLHQGNHFAGLRDGRFQPRPVWQGRWPKKLRYLEALVDSLELDERDRGERLAWLGRLEQTVRATSTRHRHAEPWISFVVDAREDEAAARSTLAALRAQTHQRCEVVWVADTAAAPGAAAFDRLVPVAAGGVPRLEAMSRAQAACRGDYYAFLEAGDRPDPLFAERHLHVLRHVALVQFSCSDFRLAGEGGALQHAGVMVGAGRWTSGVQQLPPFALAMKEWPFGPLAACVFRRTPLLDAFFYREGDHPAAALEGLFGWLLVQYAACLGGAARLGECLLDFYVRAAASASQSWVLVPFDQRGPLQTPDFPRAAEALFQVYCSSRRERRAYLSPSWERGFARWLVQAGGPQLAPRLQAQARAAGVAVPSPAG